MRVMVLIGNLTARTNQVGTAHDPHAPLTGPRMYIYTAL